MALEYGVDKSMRRLIRILLIFGLMCSAPASAEGWWLFSIPPIFKSLKQWYGSSSKPESNQLGIPDSFGSRIPPPDLSGQPIVPLEKRELAPNSRGVPGSRDQSSSAILGADQWLADPKALREAANAQRDAAKAQEVKPEGESSLQCLREAGFDTTSSSYQLCVKNIK
jgi:hypothetical protein